MTPPINIDGTQITGATIDGQDVSAITVDGTQVFSAITIPDSGVLRYDFEDDSDTGTATDLWNNNDGIINGASYTSNAADGGLALSLDGTNDSLETPYSGKTGGVTIAFWLYPTKASNRQSVVSAYSSNDGNRWDMEYNGDGNQQLRFFQGNGNNMHYTSSVISTNTYTHIIYAHNANNSRSEWYINGAPDSTASNITIDLDNTKSWSVGARPDGSVPEDRFDGVIDLYDNYSKDISDSEASNLYNTGRISG